MRRAKSKVCLVVTLLVAGLSMGEVARAQQEEGRASDVGVVDDHRLSWARTHHIVQGDAQTGPVAYSPTQIRHAYGFDAIFNQGAGQTMAIVDAYDDPNIEADLGVFDKQFNLRTCTSNNGCFRKVYATSKQPAADSDWAMEIALDVEWAHAIAPQADIVLVEAASDNLGDLLTAVSVAVRSGASTVSMSWGGTEWSGERSMDTRFVSNGVTFVAASGDLGSGVQYPAASESVLAVGGTSLSLDSHGNYLSESAWGGSGGGLSAYEFKPLYQATFGIPDDGKGVRGVPDVSYSSDPIKGFSVYESVRIANGQAGWFQVGGTSAATPQWSALIAIANSMRAAARKSRLNSTNSDLYSLAKTRIAADFHAVANGTNGSCGTICDAGPGYDFITGLGSPRAVNLIAALVAEP
jgi:subtilase family serine protease